MTSKLLRGFHIVALCIFVGSIPSHIILGILAQSAQDAEAFAVFHQAKYALTTGLTASGIGLTLFTGAILGLSRKSIFKMRWLQAKLILVSLIVINGAVVLAPLAEQMRDLAIAAVNTGALSSEFHVAETKESIAGAINLLLVFAIFYLAIFKPKFGTQSLEIKNG
jgi:hypothetical protein